MKKNRIVMTCKFDDSIELMGHLKGLPVIGRPIDPDNVTMALLESTRRHMVFSSQGGRLYFSLSCWQKLQDNIPDLLIRMLFKSFRFKVTQRFVIATPPKWLPDGTIEEIDEEESSEEAA